LLRAAQLTLVTLALIVSCAFVLPSEREPAQQPPKYFEIVVHDPTCKGNECFTEYIFLSNGLSIRKLPTTDKAPRRQVGVKQASDAATAALFSQVESFFTQSSVPNNPGVAQDQLFFFDGDKYRAYNAFAPTPSEVMKIFDASTAAFDAGTAAEDFFLHTYYQPQKGGTKDLHVFADGTVITSMFVRQTSSIMYTSMSQAKDGDIEKIRALAAAAAGAPSKPYAKCPAASGIDYGFVEFQNEGAHGRSFACGEAGNSFSPILSYMRENYGDTK
jgi:hypothetical protein